MNFDTIDWNLASQLPEKSAGTILDLDLIPLNPNLAPNQIVCPNNPTNKNDCDKIPNSLWISSQNSSSTQGTCNCCKTDGTVFVDTKTTTPGSDPCKTCPSDSACGDQDGYCKGTTGNSQATCVQDNTTLKWKADCSKVTRCGGLCSAGCGASEWFLFHKCTKDMKTGLFSCRASLDQWRSWLVWGSFIFLIFLIVIIVLVRRTKTKAVISPKD